MRAIPPIELISLAAEMLGDLRDQVTFVGGAVVGLLLTDPATRVPRATRDVDITLEVATRFEYYHLEAKLRSRGFRNAVAGPICRFERDALILDILPTTPEILGFTNRWYREAILTADRIELNGMRINLITSPCFLATKLEAFQSPSRENYQDLSASRDFEDVIAVIDGRACIVADINVAPDEMRDYLAQYFQQLLLNPNLPNAISAHLEPDDASQGRIPLIISRIQAIANL